MKKILALLLSIAMIFAFASCGSNELSQQMRVGTLVGPTGMGLIDLQDNENIDLQLYQAPTDVTQKLLSGDLDVACVPSNLGAVLYNKTKGNVQILTNIVNGVLYVVENGESVKSVKDLAGKTIYASGKGGTPEYVLERLLNEQDLHSGKEVTVQWMDNHADVAQKVASTEGAIGLLPEPQVSAIGAKAQTVKVALNLNDEWKTVTGQELPMGILVAKKDFTDKNAEDIDKFINLVSASIEDVQSASDEVVQKIVDAKIIPSAEICKAVIPNCSLVCYSAEDTEAILSPLYDELFKLNPASIGGAQPEDDIYYNLNK